MSAQKGKAGVATTEVENRRTAMLGTARLVPVPIGLYVSQMALGQEVAGVLQDLDRAWSHG